MNCRHDWIAMRTRGEHVPERDICVLCGTTYPCRRQPCEHVDCRLACGNPEPPPGVEYPHDDVGSSQGVSDA